MKEGQFKNGLLDGYGRVFNQNGEAEIGYFREGYTHGKAIYYSQGKVFKQGIFDYQKGV